MPHAVTRHRQHDIARRRSGRRALRAGAASLAVLAGSGCAESLGPAESSCAGAVAASRNFGGGDSELRLALAPGEICALLADEARSVSLESAGAASEYLVAVSSASEVPGATVSLRLEAWGAAASAARTEIAGSQAPLPSASVLAEAAASDAELRFRANARAALVGARPLRAAASDLAAPRWLRAGRASPAVGDTIVFHNSVDTNLQVDCRGVHDVVAVVRAIGSNFGIVEDVEAAGHVSQAGYAQVLQALEQFVFPVDTAYFGRPADLDGNGVVWMLFTPVVNRVTPRGSPTLVAGFFNPSDLSDPASCAASNRGELLYVLAPDPTGRFSDPVPPAFATSRAVAVAAHELEHLISAQQRIVLGSGGFANLEDAWLGEGLAHMAETAVGLKIAALSPNQNLDFARLTADRATFDAYHFFNFRRAGFHFKRSNGTLALGDAQGADPGGVASLEMRGFAWLFLRWMADQYVRTGVGVLGGAREEALFRDLARGGNAHARGIANVLRAARALGAPADWDRLLNAYALVPLADDVGGQALPTTQMRTFHLKSAFAGLNAEMGNVDPFQVAYPLLTTRVDLDETTNTRLSFDLRASTMRYLVFDSDGPHPAVRLALTTQSGAVVPSSARARLVVMRIR